MTDAWKWRERASKSRMASARDTEKIDLQENALI